MRHLALVFCAALMACSGSADPPADPPGARTDIVGEWGGTEVSMTLALSGGALQYGCASGTVGPGWSLSTAGEFAGSGEHFFEGGPVPMQGRPPHPALYTGRLDGDKLSLSVTLTDLKQTLGPFHLTRDGPPVLLRCV